MEDFKDSAVVAAPAFEGPPKEVASGIGNHCSEGCGTIEPIETGHDNRVASAGTYLNDLPLTKWAAELSGDVEYAVRRSGEFIVYRRRGNIGDDGSGGAQEGTLLKRLEKDAGEGISAGRQG